MYDALQRLRPLRNLFPLLLFAGAAWLLFREIRHYQYRDLLASLAEIPARRVWLAIGLTALNYLILVGYDLTAMWYLKRPLGIGKIALASFVSYVSSYNFGTLLGGTTVRYRMYSAWGLSTVEIVELVTIVGLTFWVGLFGVAGMVFVVAPLDIPARLMLPFSNTRTLGALLLVFLAIYLLACGLRRNPLTIRDWRVPLPPLKLALWQLAIAAADLVVAAAVLYVLLPPTATVTFPQFLNIFLLAVVASVVSNVPGGLGIMELTILLLLPPHDPQRVLGVLLVFRGVYYLLPLLLAAGMMGANELVQQRESLRRISQALGRVAPGVVPRVLSFATFVAGAVLLWSGTFPTPPARLHWIRHALPLSVLETSHFLGSLVGVALLLIAQSLRRRLDSAYWVTLGMLGVGIVLALLRGLDYEEAGVLFAVLLALLPCRRHFYRKGSLLREPLAAGWIVAVALVLVCSIWLGTFAYKHVEFSQDLWWQFTFRGDAPRFLRATVGAVGLTLVVSLARLLRPARPAPRSPDEAQLDVAARIVAASLRTSSNLALLGDKMLLLNDEQNAFIMYGIKGRAWVALGDPVGPRDQAPALVLRFRELCDAYDGWPVFYQVDAENLPWYIDVGLSAVKIGEEARVPLEDFSLEGGSRRALRKIHNRSQKLHCRMEVLPARDVPTALPALKEISDAWLQAKHAREKGFSLGRFEPDYLRRFPVAVIRHGQRIVAFANLLCGAERQELSVDLMRYLPGEIDDVMELLFIELMLWGRTQGYRWFNLGMAPLSGLEGHALAPTWYRAGALIYRHGEDFYNFQGLRQYKEKFDPVWTPKYLASRGGFTLPIILTNIATLISGGMSGLVRK